jgi:protein phosphatase
VPDEDIQNVLEMLQTNLPLAAIQLVQLANDAGGRDNISVILIRVRGSYAAPTGWWDTLKAWFR